MKAPKYKPFALRTCESDRVCLAAIMDVFTRCIRGWHLGHSLDHSLTLAALQRALAEHTLEIHHSDQGVQYAATAYTQMLQEANVQISMAGGGQAWQNGYAERVIRTSRRKKLTCRTMWTILMPSVRLADFSTTPTCSSVSIRHWAILPQLSSNISGETHTH